MTATADGQLSLDGNGYAFGIALNANGANLYTNSVSRDLIFGVNETEVMRVTDSNVGIGTTSPTSSKLHIDGGDLRIQDVTPNIYFYSEGAVNNVQINANISDAAQGGIAILENGNTLIQSRTNYTQFYSANAERMRIDSSGNVGIGDTAPLDLLHIREAVNSATATQLLLQNEGSGTNAAGIAFQVSSSGETAGFAPKAGIVFERGLPNGRGVLKFFNDNTNDSNGFSAADEVMRINGSGDVGIGTSSPTAPLDVVCNTGAVGIQLRGRSSDNISLLRFRDNAGTTTYGQFDIRSVDFRINAVANIPMLFSTNNTERMRIDTSGNVGIGTASPSRKLHTSGANVIEELTSSTAFAAKLYVSSTTTGYGRYIAAEADDMTFGRYGNAEHMRLDSSGNLKFNSGYGSVATAYGCRAWVNFNGTGTVAIRASGNVSSYCG
jgi:hypothetical protein